MCVGSVASEVGITIVPVLGLHFCYLLYLTSILHSNHSKGVSFVCSKCMCIIDESFIKYKSFVWVQIIEYFNVSKLNKTYKKNTALLTSVGIV